MIQNLLLNKIAMLQQEYKELLMKQVAYMEEDFISPALDEIVIFWKKNINLVQLFFIAAQLSRQKSKLFIMN